MIHIKLPLLSLQKGLEAMLTSDLAPIKVYNIIPENKPFPYVSIGEFRFTGPQLKALAMLAITGGVNVFSTYEGAAEAESLANAITESLSNSDIDLAADGFRVQQTKLIEGNLITRWSEVLSGYVTIFTLTYEWTIT